MLAKKYRLAAKKDFSRIYKSKKAFNTPFFTIKYIANGLSCSRLAVVVSKKRMPKAVDRNRGRRIVSAILGQFWFLLPKNVDMVVFLKPEILKAKNENLKQVIKDFLHKQQLLLP